ncbi:MAG: hypothetical protein IT364_18855 [Candidatus Hydrogenedentes bacterium]|nr:hypothetical protein [Candidatus Hydrogenedentota bacterium]
MSTIFLIHCLAVAGIGTSGVVLDPQLLRPIEGNMIVANTSDINTPAPRSKKRTPPRSETAVITDGRSDDAIHWQFIKVFAEKYNVIMAIRVVPPKDEANNPQYFANKPLQLKLDSKDFKLARIPVATESKLVPAGGAAYLGTPELFDACAAARTISYEIDTAYRKSKGNFSAGDLSNIRSFVTNINSVNLGIEKRDENDEVITREVETKPGLPPQVAVFKKSPSPDPASEQ